MLSHARGLVKDSRSWTLHPRQTAAWTRGPGGGPEVHAVQSRTRGKLANGAGDGLYVAAVSDEPLPGKMKWDVKRNDDGHVWIDDSLEVVVAPDRKGEQFYKFIVNTRGKYSVYEPDCAILM